MKGKTSTDILSVSLSHTSYHDTRCMHMTCRLYTAVYVKHNFAAVSPENISKKCQENRIKLFGYRNSFGFQIVSHHISIFGG